MRTNIEIDEALMDQALKAGPFKTKKEAVEAGLKLLARQAAYREILKYRGKLKWDLSGDWSAVQADEMQSAQSVPLQLQAPPAEYKIKHVKVNKPKSQGLRVKGRRT
ncbi:MAG: hypothetical protein RL341_1515 [Pseudomonadota bacterium]|jgi:Arc/MetJ family transcription regulator